MSFLGSPWFRELRNRVLCGATAWAVKGLFLTVRFRSEGWDAVRARLGIGNGVIFVLWHDTLMLPLGHASRKRTHMFISPGKDGDFAARVGRWFGVRAIRGSTSRNASASLLSGLRLANSGKALALTPDGPRGPRHQMQAGPVWLASRSNVPIIPLGIAVTRGWRLKSWDRFCIPKPFSRAHLVFGPPVPIPADLSRNNLEEWRARIQGALESASKEAAEKAGVARPV